MKKKYSLRFQLLLVLLVFVVAILGFIYILQTTFLDEFYKSNKIKTLKNVGNDVAQVVGQDGFDETLDQVGMSNEVCVRIVSNNEELNYTGACTLRNLDNTSINMIAQETIDNGNEKMFDNFRYQRRYDMRPENVYIYARMIEVGNDAAMIMVSSAMTPLNVTISTIKSQYLIIVGVVILMSVVLALLLSRYILKPIKEINDESKNLSRGEYDRNNVSCDSLEIDQLNTTLVEANEDILKAEKARKELLGNVSHDLRTPLTMIVGYGEMIRDLPEENNADNINVIIDEAKRLSTLVNDLIDISKLEDNNVQLHRQTVSVNELLTSVYHQYERYCSSQDIELKLQLAEDVMVDIDPDRIKQVLYNFVNNALNYNDKKEKQIIIGDTVDDGICRIYVHDNGEGIAEADKDKIWDRYYKVDKEHKRHAIGSGIGLSLSRQLLKAHGFEYGVESRLGEYSRFYFDIRISDQRRNA